MAAAAVRLSDGRLTTPDEIEQEWKKRIQQARDHRKQHEPTWLSDFAFASGKHWQVWDPSTQKMRHLSEMDPRYENAELYTADKINEHVQAQRGELQADDDRPQMLLAQEGDSAEAIQEELNDLIAHGWDNEWNADSAIRQADHLCLTLGVSAIRVRFDPTKGPVAGHLPIGADGNPVTDEQHLQHLETTGQLPDGTLPQFQTVHEGKTIWEPLSALNLLTPPGINHEDAFPWEIVVRPVSVDSLVEIYGDIALGLEEDDDIASIIGVTVAQAARTSSSDASKGRLRGHVWLFTCYERACRKYPKGRVVVLASNQMKLLSVVERLPVETVTKEYSTGIRYFHWWRNPDNFWSRSFIEPLKDPQRLINRRETQNLEITDRGMPKTFVKEGTLVHNPSGRPLEVIELKPDAAEPNFFAGIGPGSWMYEDLAHHADNMAHASTLSPLRLGENPANVLTLGQLSLLNENEAGKRSTILGERKAAIAGAVADSVYFIRAYWPEDKQILVTGDDDRISQKIFQKSKIPDFWVVRPAKGSAKPRSQAAELLKVDAIWAAIESSGLVATNPGKYVDWYVKSLDAGQPLELPEVESDSQVEMARFENFLMLDQGEDVQPQDYDLLPSHLPEHREAQNQARAAGDIDAYQRIERHVQQSIQLQAANAAKIAAATAPGLTQPAPPVGPPQLGPAPQSPISLLAAAAAAPPRPMPPIDQGAP
jgi:hypothetical protein